MPSSKNKKVKIKTHKGTVKRFRITKNGKILRMAQKRSHKLTAKKKNLKRTKAIMQHVAKVDVKKVKRLLVV
ncbi:MAG: hypothetical protein Fur0024_4380 [Patescibacteria group bacterium]